MLNDPDEVLAAWSSVAPSQFMTVRSLAPVHLMTILIAWYVSPSSARKAAAIVAA